MNGGWTEAAERRALRAAQGVPRPPRRRRRSALTWWALLAGLVLLQAAVVGLVLEASFLVLRSGS